MITLDNYEIYFADFMANTLNCEELQELKDFLLLHPELKILLDDANLMVLPKENVVFVHKNNLKKEEKDEYQSDKLIACTDNLLTDEKWIVIEKNKNNSNLENALETSKALKLIPDISIHFERKNVLYRKYSVRMRVMRATACAAGILLVGGISILFFQSPTSSIKNEFLLPAIQHAAIEIQPTPIPSTPAEIKNKKIMLKTISLKTESLVKTISQTEVINIIPQSIAAVKWEKTELSEIQIKQQLSVQSQAEIILTEDAKIWKPSTFNHTPSKNIFTSVIHLGKEIAERIKNSEFPN
ncbi:MAG: hypothetical protein RR259_00470 [Odoribacter sp.]